MIIVTAVWTILVISSRLYLNYHTSTQILVGIIHGLVLSKIYYSVVESKNYFDLKSNFK